MELFTIDLSPWLDVAAPGWILGFLALGLGIFLLLFGLIVLIEGTVLQLLRWSGWKGSFRSALVMNAASVILGFIFMALVSRLNGWGLLFSWVASVVIEWGVLMRIKRGAGQENFIASLLSNMASYGLLFVPAYFLA